MNKGIDYGLGVTNIDHENGIRFGVIHQNEVLQAWAHSSEADYGEPHCPKCGNAVHFSDDEERDTTPNYESYEVLHHACGDYACDSCRVLFDGEDALCDEPLAYNLDNGEYTATQGSDGDIFITKSPYFTRAQFCSPCAPGACYLTEPRDDGERAYCFDASWFEDNKAPRRLKCSKWRG
jgi:hypothetical protein